MQDDPSKRIDPEHPVMRTLAALFDAATEFGLTRAEVREVADEILSGREHDRKGPIARPMIDALAQRVEDKGGDGAVFREHVESRTAPLLREAQKALGFTERGE